MFNKFNSFFGEYEIRSQLSTPKTPPQNREVERGNQILMNIARLMMSFSSLSISFCDIPWRLCLTYFTSTFQVNMVGVNRS